MAEKPFLIVVEHPIQDLISAALVEVCDIPKEQQKIASTAKEAEDIAIGPNAAPFKKVLLDLDLNEGLTFLKLLREKTSVNQAVPVVALGTDDASSALIGYCQQNLGVAYYIQKPFDLLNKLQQAIKETPAEGKG